MLAKNVPRLSVLKKAGRKSSFEAREAFVLKTFRCGSYFSNIVNSTKPLIRLIANLKMDGVRKEVGYTLHK